MGKTIKVDGRNVFTVTGVVKDHRQNTDIKSDLFFSLPTLKDIYPEIADILTNQWGAINSTNSIYIDLKDGASPYSVQNNIAKLNVKAQGAEMAKAYHFMLLPLAEMHFDGRFAGVIQRSLITTLGFVSLLVIVIACVNFINMTTAQSFKRSKEIGTRKVLGGSSIKIFNQFIFETACITVVAAMLSITIVLIAMPFLNNWLEMQLQISWGDYKLILFMAGALIFIIITAGAYPAIVLSKFDAVSALKNQLGKQTKTTLFARNSLIVFQNVVAQVLIVGTIIITMQVNYLKTADLGFSKDSLVMLPIPDAAKGKTDYLRNQLMLNPGIKGVSFCYRAPNSINTKGGSIKYDTHDWEKFAGRTLIGDANYVPTFGIKLAAGRNIVESDTVKEYLINEVLMHKLGVQNPEKIIGKQFISGDLSDKAGVITGVVKDFHDASLYSTIAPFYITTYRKEYQYAGVKIKSNHPSAVIDYIRKNWQATYPDSVFEFQFLDQQINDFYKKEQVLTRLITLSAIIAIFISCLGLVGLISLLTIQRTKEIGIRKVLGASVANISALLSVSFLRLSIIAIVIASPVAWIIAIKYLQSFAYKIDLSLWLFVIGAVVTIIIALFTLSFQTIKAAIANPVKSLRSE